MSTRATPVSRPAWVRLCEAALVASVAVIVAVLTLRLAGPTTLPTRALKFNADTLTRQASLDAEQFQFTYTNTTDRPVTITRVSSNCSCTLGQPNPRTIQPGQSGTLDINVKLSQPGDTTQVVHLKTDADQTPYTLTMKIRYVAPATAKAEPKHIPLSLLPVEVMVTTARVSGEVPRVRRLTSSDPRYFAEVASERMAPARGQEARLQRWTTVRIRLATESEQRDAATLPPTTQILTSTPVLLVEFDSPELEPLRLAFYPWQLN
jgi:hypothetical protein